MDLNFGVGTDMRYCYHVQFIRMTGEFFDYFVFVNPVFGNRYIAAMKQSDPYKKYLLDNDKAPIDEETEQGFITGEYLSVSEMAAAVPYFEDVACSAAVSDSALFIEKRPYGHVIYCLGGESLNSPGT
jgi:hypothetical protein